MHMCMDMDFFSCGVAGDGAMKGGSSTTIRQEPTSNLPKFVSLKLQVGETALLACWSPRARRCDYPMPGVRLNSKQDRLNNDLGGESYHAVEFLAGSSIKHFSY